MLTRESRARIPKTEPRCAAEAKSPGAKKARDGRATGQFARRFGEAAVLRTGRLKNGIFQKRSTKKWRSGLWPWRFPPRRAIRRLCCLITFRSEERRVGK